MIAYADVGSHGGIFCTEVSSCKKPECENGRLVIYKSKFEAQVAGARNIVKVKIINTK